MISFFFSVSYVNDENGQISNFVLLFYDFLLSNELTSNIGHSNLGVLYVCGYA